MSGLGLIVTEIEKEHQELINSFKAPPVAFKLKDRSSLPSSADSAFQVYDQGGTSSCAGNALAGLFTEQQNIQTGELIRYSAWFAYITAQKEGGFLGSDGGTSISSTIQAGTKYGCCLESLCRLPSRYTTSLSQQAYDDAAQHKHLGEGLVDLRAWEDMIDWITDARGLEIGTKWYSSQDSMNSGSWIETKARASGGAFRGYHARQLFYWETIDGEICPKCRNSHGDRWAKNGRSVITRELWDWWKKDANFCAYGFCNINERIPQRRDLSQFSFILGDRPSIG